MFIKSKNKTIIIAIAVLFLVIALAITHSLLTRNSETPGVTPSIPEISFDGDIGYSNIESDSDVLIHATTGFVFNADSLEQKVCIENPSENMYDFVVSIYLGDGTLVYHSDYIHPGDSVTSIKTELELESGVYANSIIVYHLCSTDNSHSVISQCEFPIEIRCVN